MTGNDLAWRMIGSMMRKVRGPLSPDVDEVARAAVDVFSATIGLDKLREAIRQRELAEKEDL